MGEDRKRRRENAFHGTAKLEKTKLSKIGANRQGGERNSNKEAGILSPTGEWGKRKKRENSLHTKKKKKNKKW